QREKGRERGREGERGGKRESRFDVNQSIVIRVNRLPLSSTAPDGSRTQSTIRIVVLYSPSGRGPLRGRSTNAYNPLQPVTCIKLCVTDDETRNYLKSSEETELIIPRLKACESPRRFEEYRCPEISTSSSTTGAFSFSMQGIRSMLEKVGYGFFGNVVIIIYV
ncbi:hypothetical protein WH47_00953, partial [Habropoda laboriosa]